MLVMIDNYDSFTYNLVQAFGAMIGAPAMEVVRNDSASVEQLAAMNPTHLIVSPGPGAPDDAGVSVSAIHSFAGRVPILGVCLGHQCIMQAFGATVVHAARQMHGKVSEIHHDQEGVYTGLPNPFTATRYHSLIVDAEALPDGFEVSAWTDRDELMGVRHDTMPLEGVQFHPESFLTEWGDQLLANFLRM